jgi:hypothetical protein
MKHKLHNNRFVTNLLKPHTEKKIAASARFSNLTTLTAMRKLFLFMLLMNSTLFTKAQTQVRMTLANPIQISDHEFEFDVFIKNSGTTSLGLVNYSFGVDYAPGLAKAASYHTPILQDREMQPLQVFQISPRFIRHNTISLNLRQHLLCSALRLSIYR